MWAQHDSLLCLGSYKAAIKMSSRAVFSSGGSGEDCASKSVLPVGRSQLLVVVRLTSHLPAGCWPLVAQMLEASQIPSAQPLPPQNQQQEPRPHQIPFLLQISFQEEHIPFQGLTLIRSGLPWKNLIFRSAA